MAKRTRHQERIIKRYYDNRDAISLQRVQEILTELYLSEGKRREQQWKLIMGHLEKLNVPQSRLDQINKTKDINLLAKLVDDLAKKG